jgi:adenylylsulfate kinase-like enzyme
VSDPYEEPSSPELVIDTESATPSDSAAKVLELLAERGLAIVRVPA